MMNVFFGKDSSFSFLVASDRHMLFCSIALSPSKITDQDIIHTETERTVVMDNFHQAIKHLVTSLLGVVTGTAKHTGEARTHLIRQASLVLRCFLTLLLP